MISIDPSGLCEPTDLIYEGIATAIERLRSFPHPFPEPTDLIYEGIATRTSHRDNKA